MCLYYFRITCLLFSLGQECGMRIIHRWFRTAHGDSLLQPGWCQRCGSFNRWNVDQTSCKTGRAVFSTPRQSSDGGRPFLTHLSIGTVSWRSSLHFSNAAILISRKATVCCSMVQSVHFQVSYRSMMVLGKSKAFAAAWSGSRHRMFDFSLCLSCSYRLRVFIVVIVIREVEIRATWTFGSEGRIDGLFHVVIQQCTDLGGILWV